MSGIEPVQEYNDLIKQHLLDAIQRGIVGGLPQPTMFGGKRMRNFVLPASTEYDYPSSLSVGHLGASQPDMLGGSFWDDFGKGFKQGVSGVSKVAMPIVKEVGTELAKDAIRSYAKGSGRRRKKGGFLIGRDGLVRPQAEGGYIGMTGNPYNESGFGSANTQLDNHPHFYSGGVVSGGSIWDTFKSGFSQVGNAIAPVAKEIFHDVVVPEGKDYLKQQIKERREKGGSMSSAIIAKMIGKQRKGFDINKVNRPSGNAVNYAKKAFGQNYKGKKPSDMWNTYKGEIMKQEAPKKRGPKPKPKPKSKKTLIIESDSDEEYIMPPAKKAVKKPAKKTLIIDSDSDEEEFIMKPKTKQQKMSGRGLTGGDILGDLGKVGQSVMPFLPLLMGLGRGDQMPPHPCGGNWADDLGNISKAIAPFAPLLMGLGRGKMPTKTAINKIIKCGGNWTDDLAKVSSAIAPFAPLLMGLGRGGSINLDEVGQEIAQFSPLLMGLGRAGKAVRRTPTSSSFQGVKGGVMIMDNPSQFHQNTGLMPPALASYNPPVPSVSGKGRRQKKSLIVESDSDDEEYEMKPRSKQQIAFFKKQKMYSDKYEKMLKKTAPKPPKRVSPRGAIVAKVMREMGLSLPQASKYVKDNNLYKSS